MKQNATANPLYIGFFSFSFWRCCANGAIAVMFETDCISNSVQELSWQLLHNITIGGQIQPILLK
jgi:hypothetical protein